MIAVLSAIAAPGWLALVNNQRVSTARSQISEALRDAQAQARRTKTKRAFVMDSSTGKLRIAVINAAQFLGLSNNAGLTTANLGDIKNWQVLGNGEIQPGGLEFTVLPISTKGPTNFIVFDDYGSITNSSGSVGTVLTPFIVTLNAKGSGSKRCVSVITVVGGLGEASDDECTQARVSGSNDATR